MKNEVVSGSGFKVPGPIKSNSVGGAMQLSHSMMDQLTLLDSSKQKGGACS